MTESTPIKSFVLLIISSTLALIAIAGLMQVFLEPGKLYSSFHGVPALHQRKSEVDFWEKYKDRELLNSYDYGYDPELGWDIETTGDRIRGSKLISKEPDKSILRILAVGDSFTFGMDVGEHENFPYMLGKQIPHAEVLNMGVPGYGIDQAYLKYRSFGQSYRPDVIIFGVYVSDYERSSVTFTFYAKPKFTVTDGQLMLSNQPVPTLQESLKRIDASLAEKVYLFEILKNTVQKIKYATKVKQSFFDENNALITQIFSELKSSLSDNQTLLIVHIPKGESFIKKKPFREEISNSLVAIYEKLGIPYIDLRRAFMTDDIPPTSVVKNYYVVDSNGSVGHLNAHGHAKVSELIVDALKREQAISLDEAAAPKEKGSHL
jgi:hypothetical protein